MEAGAAEHLEAHRDPVALGRRLRQGGTDHE